MSVIDEWLILCRAQVEGSGFQKLNKQIKGTRDSLFSVKNLFHAFVGYDIYSGIKAFGGSIIQASKDLGAMNSRFYAITKSQTLANKELQWSFNLAQRTATDIKSVADAYSIFYASAQRSMGTDAVHEIFQNWTEVSRVLHLSSYQFERVMYAMRELSNKGAIYSNDLRMQIGTHVPDALGMTKQAVEELSKSVAKSLGYEGADWFEKFQQAVKGNQKLINAFLLEFSRQAKTAYASPEALRKSLEQTDSVMTALSNTWKLFIFNLTKAGFTKELIKDVKFLNNVLEKITSHANAIYNITKLILTLFVSFNIAKGIMFLIIKFQELRLQLKLLSMDAKKIGVTSTTVITKIRTGINLLKKDVVAMEAMATLGLSLIIDLIIDLIINWDKWVKRFRNWQWLRQLHTLIIDIKNSILDMLYALSKIPGFGGLNPFKEDVTPNNNMPSNPSLSLPNERLSNVYGKLGLGASTNSAYNTNNNIRIENQISIDNSTMSQDEMLQFVKDANRDLAEQITQKNNEKVKNALRK